MESYWYADTTSPEAMENYNSILRVKTNLETGKQCVTWSVPASMIPLVTYKIAVNANSLDKATQITMDCVSNNPIRAVFDVGLRDEINRYNAVAYLKEAGYTPNSDGSYTFYSNQWQVNSNGNIPVQPSTDRDTASDLANFNVDEVNNSLSYFRPSEQNERYNVTEATPLYNADGTPWTGSGDKYIKHITFTRDKDEPWNKDGNAELTAALEKVTANSANIKEIDGKYYVLEGTVDHAHHQAIAKESNPTGTYQNSFYETTCDEDNVSSILGNNGMFSFVPDTGIIVTKKLSTGTTTDNFTFVIAPTAGSGIKLADKYDVYYLDAGATDVASYFETRAATSVSTVNNTLTVSIAPGQMAYIAGLPTGSYTVSEQAFDGSDHTYVVSNVEVGGVVRDPSAEATVTVENCKMVELEYTNTRVNSGSIAITKAVNGNPPSDSTFTFEVNLGSARAGKVFTKKIGTATSSVTADADGKLTVSIKAGEKATISGIPANTSVTVTETNLPAGYTVDGQAALTKTVTEGDTVTFNYTNNYNAADTSVTFSGTKTLDGRDLTTNDKFTFELYETDSTYSITGKTAIQTTQNGANGAYTFTKIDYTAPGTHYYVVKESAGSISGVTYDGTVYEIQVVVTDNNAKLEATVTGATANALNFTNTYTPAGTSVTLSGEKALEGRDLANGEFTFELYEVAGADAAVVVGAKPTQTATNGADGAYTFAKIDYTTPGTHYYVVKESIPADKQGVTYDTTEYRVTVDVTDNKNGQLETTVTTNNKNSLDFTNTYQAADGSITLSGTKTLTGRTLKDGEFSFTLTETESDFTTPVTGGTTETVTNVNGAFTFGAITYTAPGTHYYTVAENAGTLGGVTYDTTLYRVTVTVTDNGLGQLITAATYAKVNGETTSAAEGMAFANTYTAAKGSITLSGTKAISGYRELKADEFTFELYAADANYAITDTNPLRTATNAAETGAYAFEAIEYTTPDTYYYVVKEQAGSLNGMTYDTTEYHVAVTVVDNLSGALVATAAVTTPANLAPETAPTGTTLNFTNSYDAEDVTVPVGGAKTLTGRDLQNGEFEFVLYQANSDFATDGNALQTVKNGADGKFTFTDLSFSQPGTYYYVVQEKSTGLAGVTYDTTVYQITVVVTDDPDNAKLVANATVTVNKAATDKTPATLTFVNAYDAEDISVVLSGAKTLVGRPLGNEEFSFTLYAADESFTAGTAIETVQNNGANFSFTALEYEKAGTYYYVVKEDAGTLPGVTYDETVYHVTVTVTDNASSGKLEVVSKVEKASAEAAVAALALVEVPVSGLDFTNTYKAKSVSVPLSATKTLTGRNLLADEFTFKLVNPANGNTIIARNAADGSISLGNLAFTEAGTYTYTLSEVLPAEADRLPSVAYDAAVYTVTIVVTDNYAEGKLESDVTYSKDGASVEALTFTNVYDAESVPVVISATKTLTGRDLLEGEFSFKLVNPANGNTLLARNAADGSISFGTLMFTKAGTYNFTLEEIIPADADKLPGVAYDPTVYNITVVVTDNTETGKLVATTTYAKADGTPVEALTFNNTYNADAVPMSITATKVLTGRDLLEGEFSFKLVNPANGNTLLARNAADGSIAFGTLMFTKAGTYTYTLEEVMPEEPLPGVAYDPTVYTVTIEVTDNTLTGKLEAQVTFTAPDSTDPAEPVFTNVYDADSVIVPLSATKELTGLTLKEGDFSFALTNTDRNNVIVSRNKADGSISFGSLMFGNAGTYHFTLAEIKPEDALPGVIYDDRVYDVTIVVTDNTVTGKLEAETTFTLDGEEVEALTFSNQYVPSSVSVRLSGVKHLQGAELAEGMFTFQLYAADSRFTPVGAPVTAVNTADGSFSFASRTFTQAGVYHYVVMEDGSDPLPSITYDPTVYHVTITVRDTGAGYLTATTRIATSDGATVSEMAFENIFFEAPDTGDHTTLNTYLALCLVSLTGLMALVLRRKRA